MIEIRRLAKSYGGFRAVDDVSFRVEAGETFALLGPNGSGKTTILKCLVGLTQPTSGEIFIDGTASQSAPCGVKRLVSYLPQRVVFHESLTSREVLEFYCRLRKLPLGRIDSALQASSLQLNGFGGKLVSELSGGMVQRLGIAIAMLPDPPVLVLDEPTISLDPAGALAFRELIASLKRQGKTIIFSSHVLADVEALADRAGVLIAGKLVTNESVATLRQALAAASRLRLRLLNSEDRFRGVALQAGATHVEITPQGLVISSKPEARLAVLDALQAAGAKIQHFVTEEPSLEEIYLRYVSEKSPASPDPPDGGLSSPSA